MLLNRIEFVVTNNPIRAALQRHFEARWLLRMGGDVENGLALEVGCGRGIGVGIILDVFGARGVDAFDLDPRMLERAARRLHRRGRRVRLWQGDATAIPVANDSYEAVFDFEIIHHISNWRDALAEIHRVLKPGGMFYAGEILARAILNPISRRLFDHPLQDRFDHDTFRGALDAQGLRTLASKHIIDHVGWFVAVKEDPDGSGRDGAQRGTRTSVPSLGESGGSMSDYTHAGGIVYRRDPGATRYLIVTAKRNPGHWVLPKGHIESGESAEQTALREVSEETGVTARIGPLVGSSRFDLDDESVNSAFFLMEYLAEEAHREDRRRRWCTLEEGIELLSFPDTRELLRKAHMQIGQSAP